MWERLLGDLIEVWFWSSVSKRNQRPAQTQLQLPPSRALEAAFRVPPRGHYELNATQHQKRKLELMGARNYELIDSLGREQAKYLIEFHEALKISRQQEFERLRAQAEYDDSISRRNVFAGVFLTLLLLGLIAFFLVSTSQRSSEPAAPEATSSTGPRSDVSAPTTTVTPSRTPVPAPRKPFNELCAESQRRAVAKYPALGVAGSRSNRAFLSRLDLWKSCADPRLLKPDWPERLADECAASP